MLVLPNGLGPKKTETLTPEEIEWLANGEQLLRKLNLTLACPRCLSAGLKTGAVLRGNNDLGDRSLSVTCDCRHMVFPLRAD